MNQGPRNKALLIFLFPLSKEYSREWKRPNRWITASFFTVCLYDDDILSVIKMVVFSVFLKETDHLFDSLQCCVNVGGHLSPVTYRWAKGCFALSWFIPDLGKNATWCQWTNEYCVWMKKYKQAPTGVIKVRHFPYDLLRVTTYFRFCDGYNVFGLAGEWQYVELHLYLVGVQLEGTPRTHAVSPLQRKTGRQTAKQTGMHLCAFHISHVVQTFLIRSMVAFLDFSKSWLLMLPDVSSKM